MARRLQAFLACWAFAMAFPAIAAAQSAFTGTVRDTSGAVLPGVTVEVSSPVLIEGTRSTVTDSDGQYRITDLRPGVYTVTFTLPGFKQQRQEKVELRVDFVGTLNGTLEVGAIEEADHGDRRVAHRRRLEQLQGRGDDRARSSSRCRPAAPSRRWRSWSAASRSTSPTSAGRAAMQQTYMSTRGLTSANNIVTVDGLMVNGLDGDGAVQQYFNQAMMEEMSYQTSGAGADVSPGGVRMNIVPKDGGNRFSGSFFSAWTDKAWQSDNLDPGHHRPRPARPRRHRPHLRLQPRRRRPDQARQAVVLHLGPDVVGGRADCRHLLRADGQHVSAVGIAGAEAAPSRARQGIDDQSIESALLRLTWQITPKHKFAVYYDEINKARGHGMNPGDDPVTASQIWTSPRYNSAAAKYTGTLSNTAARRGRLLVQLRGVRHHQPGRREQGGVLARVVRRRQPPRPELHAALTNGLANWGGRYPDRFNMMARAVLHHRLAQHQGRHPVQLGPLRQHPRDQRRPAAGLRRDQRPRPSPTPSR